MWNEVFSAPEYVYGTEPSAFLPSCADLLIPGQTALSVADGEGRNSVWLAAQGLDVTAFDGSEAAIDKARTLAAQRGVNVDYHLSRIEDWDWSAQYDVVVGIFIQFAPPALRARIFAGMKQAVKPGGLILLQGYRPEQIAHGTGGPRNPDHLYTRALLEDAFGDFDILRLREHDSVLAEGSGHAGMSALIDLVARAPNA